MVWVPVKVERRIKANLNKYKKILRNAEEREFREANTVPIVMEMLADLMGWDKFEEISREYEIKKTYCDIGIEINGKLKLLVEVKAIYNKLSEDHLKQASDYAARKGIDWVILTNGIEWRAYKVILKDKIVDENIFNLNFLEINARNKKALEQIYSISKEGILKHVLRDMYSEKQVTNRYTIASLIMSEPVLKVLKREIKKVGDGVKIEDKELLEILQTNVIKNTIVESEKLKESTKHIKKQYAKIRRKAK